MTFSDPTVLRGQAKSPSEILSDELETATDAYAEACDKAAFAENDYLRAYSAAFLQADVAATIRPKTAECLSVEKRALWNVAVGVEKARRAKVEEIKHRLMAAMSHARIVGGQT